MDTVKIQAQLQQIDYQQMSIFMTQCQQYNQDKEFSKIIIPKDVSNLFHTFRRPLNSYEECINEIRYRIKEIRYHDCNFKFQHKLAKEISCFISCIIDNFFFFSDDHSYEFIKWLVFTIHLYDAYSEFFKAFNEFRSKHDHDLLNSHSSANTVEVQLESSVTKLFTFLLMLLSQNSEFQQEYNGLLRLLPTGLLFYPYIKKYTKQILNSPIPWIQKRRDHLLSIFRTNLFLDNTLDRKPKRQPISSHIKAPDYELIPIKSIPPEFAISSVERRPTQTPSCPKSRLCFYDSGLVRASNASFPDNQTVHYGIIVNLT